ncbi:ArsR/SmtB family transcription factor [Pseudorhodobacter aquimaris]|uniref:ArsR/SmtB family transcription factor n=1 Tax=Pseudorhodobacter aquimaris TaxID=687412 RepID=UPI0009FA0FDE|nr:metalloregulator ArsR/SmtB family transcription factor [Pseudorhodobacter aquimaris]
MSVDTHARDLVLDGTPAVVDEVIPAEELIRQAEKAANFLKALSHEGRLMILCHLISGEKSVTELETLLGSRQAAVSQQLARLRLEGLVESRRDGKAIYYTVSDPRAQQMMSLIHEIFCA